MPRQFMILPEELVRNIEKVLAELVRKTQAKYAMVVDRSGYVLVTHGQPIHVHPEELGAIAAGVLAAMQVIVNLAESQETTLKFHSKTMTNFHFAWINTRLFLLVAFDGSGGEAAVRTEAKNAVQLILPHLTVDETQPGDLGSVRFIEDKLSEMLKDL